MKTRTIPFGYGMERGEVIIEQNEAKLVRQIYALYIGGLGYKLITRELNRQEISYRPGAIWNQNMVKRILEDERYLGKQGYPVIVQASDFEAVAVKKAENPHRIQKRREKPEPVLDCLLLPYAPTPKILRMTNEINRALEKSPDPKIVKPMIFACAAEKYNAIGVTRIG